MNAFATGLMILTMIAMAGAQQIQKPAITNESASSREVAANTAVERIEEYLNPNEPIKVAAGHNFSIRIPSNPTTGYGWTLAKPMNETVAVLVTNNYIQERTDTLRVGVGGHEVWTFRAVNQGQTDICLHYVRPWEKDVPPARTNVFTVIVK